MDGDKRLFPQPIIQVKIAMGLVAQTARNADQRVDSGMNQFLLGNVFTINCTGKDDFSILFGGQ